ncbi:MAG: hypothetical protein WDZ39_01050 [Candidatus Spechtbacterales bacterium]
MSDKDIPQRIGGTLEFYNKLEELLMHDISNTQKHLQHIDTQTLSGVFDDPILRIYAISWLDDAKAHTAITQRNLQHLFRLIRESIEKRA